MSVPVFKKGLVCSLGFFCTFLGNLITPVKRIVKTQQKATWHSPPLPKKGVFEEFGA